MARVIYPLVFFFGLLIISVVSITRSMEENEVKAVQVKTDLIKMESSQRREMRPDDESWLVIDQIYQVSLNHGEFSENDQLKKVILTLTSKGYRVNSMTVTSYFAMMRYRIPTPLFHTDEVANTVTLFVSK